ncbi:hypothetical protein NA57DRAFT_76233 [Rhizodiscina lignyota]|uniref:DH domain-containing protein n=1 Tax=Rhizodiscina lignyota TaxID=1504668 RepID=A0A9P4M947_9PEZI|nr:hypothetical protein NA57DRAFT_76233 [Rhizodiscina lignyota]
MQSEDQRNDGATRLARSPHVDLSATPGAFPVSPAGTTGSLSPPSQSVLSADSPTDPDAFYRAYDSVTSPSSGHPYDVDPLRDPYDTTMTSTQSRIPRTANGTLPKSSTSAHTNPSRANLRSTSSPTSFNPTSANSGGKPRSATSNAPRVASGSIRDRVRQIEQANASTSSTSVPRYGNSRVPSASSGASSRPGITEKPKDASKPATLQKRPPSAQGPRNRIHKPPPEPIKTNTRRSNNDQKMLFGEVIEVNANGGLGHGIPTGIPTNHAKRSASEGNIQSPIASPQSSRSHSRLDTPSSALSSRSASALGSPHHNRSQSESAASPILEQSEDVVVNDRSSQFQLPATTFGQGSRPPTSRTPAQMRRYSASTEHLPSASNRDHLSTARPATPPGTLAQKRYVRSPSKTPTSNHSVNAFIRELPDKSIPPPSLRSSRPRIPVSAASTAASRAKQSDKMTPAKGSRSTSPAPPSSKERRPRTKGMLRAAEEARQKSKSRNRKVNYAATDSSPEISRTTSREAHFDQEGEYEEELMSRPDLVVDTTADPASNELESGLTEIDDDSPILGRTVYQPVDAGQRHDRTEQSQPEQHQPRPLSPIEASPDLSKLQEAEQDAASGAEATASRSQENLLQHVLRMRGSTLSNNGTISSLLSGDDTGTIQVAWGATPILESAEEPWGHGPIAQSVEFTTPKPEEFNDTLGHTPGSFNPDDSVSMILGPKSAQTTPGPGPSKATPTVGQTTPGAASQQFTLTSEQRDEINQIFMYYNSQLVLGPLHREFQGQVAAISPNLAREEDWANTATARDFLKSLLVMDTDSAIQTPIEGPSAVARPDFASPDREAQPTPATSQMSYPYEGTPEGDDWQPGYATVHLGPEIPPKDYVDSPSAQDFYRQNSATSAPSEMQHEYWQTVDENGIVTHRPPLPPKDTGPGSFNGLGLEFTSPQLPPIQSAGQGLGLGLPSPTSPEQLTSPISRSVPALPPHAPPPPPPLPSAPTSIMSPPPLPMTSPPPLPISPTSQNRPRPSPVGAYSNPLGESSAAIARGKRQVPDRTSTGAESSNTARLSADVGSQYSGNHHRSYSAHTTGDAASSGRPSLEPTMTASSSATVTIDSSTAELKRLQKRRHLIKELVDTEYSYNQDMVILEDIYKATAAPILSKEDLKILFGNLETVRSLSTRFLDALKKAAAPVYTLPKSFRWNFKRGSFSTSNSGANDTLDRSTEDLSEADRDAKDRDTRIGRVFCDHLPDLERTYGDYLRNRTRANNRLAELQQVDSVKLWLNECGESAKDLTAHPTLDSFLLKPFQRITRYPLLLKGLVEQTPQDHPDRQNLDSASDAVMHATSTINARQKRDDLVQQVMSGQTAPTKDGKSRPFGKLMKGKTSKVQQYVGMINHAEDKEYEKIAQKFGGHFFQLQIVMRDIEKYLDDVTDYVTWYGRFAEGLIEYLGNSYGDNPEMDARLIRFGQTIKSIQGGLLDMHRKEVRAIVIEPIVTLWKQHDGPQKMMQKRKKRVPEYAKYKDMLDKGVKPDKRMEQQADEFIAVNDTLKEELPKLYTLTKHLIEACLARFVGMQVKWQQMWIKNMKVVLADSGFDAMNIDLNRVQLDYRANSEEVQADADSFKICNGFFRRQFTLSPTTTFSVDSGSTKRPSTHTSRSDQTIMYASDSSTHRLSASALQVSPLSSAFPTPTEQYQAGRTRATSATSRSPATPHRPTYTPPQSAYPSRPATAAAQHHNDLSPNVPRQSTEDYYARRPSSSSNYLSPEPTPNAYGAIPSPTHVSPNFQAEAEAERRRRQRQEEMLYQDAQTREAREFYAGASSSERRQRTRSRVFSSAVPDPSENVPPSPGEDDDPDAGVLFLAASLFEFRIDPSRTEGGYPYLRYAPGEVFQVFDVLGIKGELWLARNQDDKNGTIGWIWEKHFARILDA